MKRAVAETYVVVAEKLRDGQSGANSAQKALVRVLRQCKHILDPPRVPGVGRGHADSRELASQHSAAGAESAKTRE
jgi:hypothetical protein